MAEAATRQLTISSSSGCERRRVELATGHPPADTQRGRRDQGGQPGEGGDPLAQTPPAQAGKPAPALGAEDDDVGTPLEGGLGDAIGRW